MDGLERLTPAARPRLLYASAGFTTHDRRFLSAAVDHGWDVFWMRCDGATVSLDRRRPPAGVTVAEWLGAIEPLTVPSMPRFIEAFRQMAAEIAPAVVHAGPLPTVGYVAVRAAAAPVLVASWGSDLLFESRRSGDVRERTAVALAGSSGVLVDCETVAEEARLLGARGVPVAVIPWGVELDLLPYATPSPQPDRLRLVSLRSLEAVYDIPTLLAGFAEASRSGGRFTLTIAGDGSLQAELKALAGRLGIADTVRWTGRVPEGKIPALLQDHDLHLSTALSDGSSISLLQAMAVGRPSIVSDLPANREWVVADESGWLFEPGNATSLAQAIVHASMRRNMFAAMAANGRAAVEARGDWNRNRRRIADLYRHLADRV